MSNDYASNCPVSWPISFPNLNPEVNANGVMFSYQIGLVYNSPDEVVPLRTPPAVR